ncbi:MAG: acetamidase/formamidase family protein [Christensenellales bacterium]
MDCKYLTKGTSLYLPVQVPGALLCTGDIHALQGDGEIVCGLEVPGKITLKVEVIKDKAEPCPMLETPERWYMLASEDTIEKSNWEAIDKMLKFLLKRSDKYTLTQWISLMGICGDLEFCQVVDPLVTIRYGIDKSVAPDLTF